MLNNEFKLIGTVISDFKEIGSEKFSKKKMMLEVEKKSKGKAVQYPIIIYGINGLIDTNKSLVGCCVIVNGYIDVYKEFVSLVAQDLYVVGAGKPTITEIKINPEPSKEEPVGGSEYDEDIKPKVEIPDDELPF